VKEALKTATAIVGLLAAVVTGLYLLGGLVIALRLLFDHFEFNAVVSTIGQLPRAPVVATALIDVIGPAVAIGLVLALLYGSYGGPRASRRDRPGTGRQLRWWAVFPALAAAFLATSAGFWVAHEHEGPAPGLRWILAALLLAPVLAACWVLSRRLAVAGWSRILRALAAGGLWALIALIPMLLISTALPFEHAQVCLSGATAPVKGRLIGEGGNRILVEEQFGQEAGVIALPADKVTLSEYGDLSSQFVCPLPPGQKAAGKVAEADLGGHGSETEQRLAEELRPRLRFDSEEHWRPLAVNVFAGEEFEGGEYHELCDYGAADSCMPLKSLSQLVRGPGEPGYVDIHGAGKNGDGYESADPACIEKRQTVTVLDCNSGPRAVMYYRRTTHEGRWYWDYWWFLRYNDYSGFGDSCDSLFCGDHEGDWEGLTVITTSALTPEIIGALYAAHSERVLVEGSVLPRSGTHPLVFVAKGTHASYPYWCAGNCRQYARAAGELLPETHHDGAVPWGANSDAECKKFECVQPFPEVGRPGPQALPLAGGWAGWPGRWGGSCHHGCEHVVHGEPSPRSPGTQPRFLCPWAATRVALPRADGSGLSRSERVGDAERLYATCAAQHGGL
jgi:hypothetical protein